jgi:hypothetical protein
VKPEKYSVHIETEHSKTTSQCFPRSVNVKWGKEKFSEIECNTDEAPLIFKSALYSLTGVVPERMKVMVKGKAIGVCIFHLLPGATL